MSWESLKWHASRLRWRRSRQRWHRYYLEHYGPPVFVEDLLDADRHLRGTFEGVHLVFPGTLTDRKGLDDPPRTFYGGSDLTIRNCLITVEEFVIGGRIHKADAIKGHV